MRKQALMFGIGVQPCAIRKHCCRDQAGRLIPDRFVAAWRLYPWPSAIARRAVNCGPRDARIVSTAASRSGSVLPMKSGTRGRSPPVLSTPSPWGLGHTNIEPVVTVGRPHHESKPRHYHRGYVHSEEPVRECQFFSRTGRVGVSSSPKAIPKGCRDRTSKAKNATIVCRFAKKEGRAGEQYRPCPATPSGGGQGRTGRCRRAPLPPFQRKRAARPTSRMDLQTGVASPKAGWPMWR